MAWLAEYGLFLAKALTIVFSILIVLITGFALSQRKKAEAGTVNIENISEKIQSVKQDIQHRMISSKAEKKAFLKAEKAAHKAEKKAQTKTLPIKPRLFVIRFDGDIRASQVTNLRECITAILLVAKPDDQVLAIIDSAGGMVHTYGLAASQIRRLRDKQLNVIVAIDTVAASGGYMMAAVANQIIAAPFAIIGSIGVVGQIPNFHRLLNKHNIDFEQHTAGQFKRTLTIFGKNTSAGREKFQEDLEQTHRLFKNFITDNRPQVDVEEVATGEHWHAIDALKLKLVDNIQTSDDFLLNQLETQTIYEVTYQEKKNLKHKLGLCASQLSDLLSRFQFFK